MSYFSVGAIDFGAPMVLETSGALSTPTATAPTAAERCAAGDYAACLEMSWDAAKGAAVDYGKQKVKGIVDKYTSPPPSSPASPDQMLNASVGARPSGRVGFGARTQTLLAGRGIAGIKKPMITSQLQKISTSQVKAVQAAAKSNVVPAVAGAAILWLLLA